MHSPDSIERKGYRCVRMGTEGGKRPGFAAVEGTLTEHPYPQHNYPHPTQPEDHTP